MIEQAQTIVSASANSGIRNLVYALAGYSPSTEEVIAAFKHYVRDEAKKYDESSPVSFMSNGTVFMAFQCQTGVSPGSLST